MGVQGEVERAVEAVADRLATAGSGIGPLYQRDYWTVLDGCTLKPSEVVRLVSERFERFAPEDVVRFTPRQEGGRIAPGDVIGVEIAGAGSFEVTAIHADAQSFTLATLQGHPEAGRITFGAYRDANGEVLFHIRSRARSSTGATRVGFLGIGEAMQTRTWTAFVNRVAVVVARGPKGVVRAETCSCEDEPEEDARGKPTYEARGD